MRFEAQPEATPAPARVRDTRDPPTVQPGHTAAPGFVQQNAVSLLLGEALFFVLAGILLWRRMTRHAMRTPAGLGQLTTAVDAIAVEVERISENQRYVTKLLNEKLLQPGAGAAQPIPATQKVGRSE